MEVAGVVEHCEYQTAIQEFPDGHDTTVLALRRNPLNERDGLLTIVTFGLPKARVSTAAGTAALHFAATAAAILFRCPNCCAYSLRLNSNVTFSAS